MDEIRQQLTYKDNLVTICMAKLSSTERYDCIRLILATRTQNVQICTHEATNCYINSILKKLSVKFVRCWEILPCLQSLPLTDA